MPDSAIAKQAFIISKSLFSRNKQNFHKNLENTLELYDIEDTLKLGNNLLSDKMLDIIKAKMKDRYFTQWKSELSSSKKLVSLKIYKIIMKLNII